ncbi:MAG: RIO kinase 1 [Candidatus Woesearchaeota archaeon]|jgi:RIO kinase 1
MPTAKEKWKIYNNVFDEFTLRVLHKLEGQGHYSELKSSLSLGKEANIFVALQADGTPVIVKIYRLENCNFNKMFDYIKCDPRYLHLKGRRREIIFAWVQREFRNLLLAREAGIRVPTVLAVKDNVIVMQCIGTPPALQAKNAALKDPEQFIKEVVELQKQLIQKAKLVHADLSMFNILVDKEKPVFIDMSQSTNIEDSNTPDYLARDATNVAAMAKRMGVTITKEDILKEWVVK